MPVPQRKLEVEFTAGTWTDVSADLLVGHSITRGRTAEQGQPAVGEAQFMLRNKDGQYDPANTSSPYAGKVLPLKRIRYSIISGGTTYRRFTGRVLGWPQSWPKQGRFGIVTVQCADFLRDLSGATYPRSYGGQVADDGPAFWWRLNEPVALSAFVPEQTMQSSDSPPYDVALTAATTETSLVTSLVPGDGLGARRVTGIAPQIQGSIFAPSDFTVEVLWKPEALGANGTFAYPYRSSSTGTYVRAAYTGTAATATYQASIDNPGVGTQTITLSTAVRPVAGRTDHVVLKRTGNLVAVIVNNTILGSVTIQPGSIGLGSGGGGAARFGDRDTAGQVVVIDEPAIYLTALPDSRIASHYATILTPVQFAGSTVAARVTAILDAAGWPSADRVIANSGRQVQPTGDLGGKTILQALQDAVGVDLGLVFCDHLGRIVTLDRPASGVASTLTFGDAVTGTELPYLDDLTVSWDDSKIANDITVTAPGEPVLQARTTNAASISTYGTRTAAVSAPWATQADVDAAATYLIGRAKDPRSRVDRMTLDLSKNPALIPGVLGIGAPGPVVTVVRRPAPAPTITVRCIVEQIAETGSTDQLQVRLTLSPAP